ncbi:hypothetical protein [Streptomyces fodineus]|nr:hypothetical protein [Streptomyces fodineus]
MAAPPRARVRGPADDRPPAARDHGRLGGLGVDLAEQVTVTV